MYATTRRILTYCHSVAWLVLLVPRIWFPCTGKKRSTLVAGASGACLPTCLLRALGGIPKPVIGLDITSAKVATGSTAESVETHSMG